MRMHAIPRHVNAVRSSIRHPLSVHCPSPTSHTAPRRPPTQYLCIHAKSIRTLLGGPSEALLDDPRIRATLQTVGTTPIGGAVVRDVDSFGLTTLRAVVRSQDAPAVPPAVEGFPWEKLEKRAIAAADDTSEKRLSGYIFDQTETELGVEWLDRTRKSRRQRARVFDAAVHLRTVDSVLEGTCSACKDSKGRGKTKGNDRARGVGRGGGGGGSGGGGGGKAEETGEKGEGKKEDPRQGEPSPALWRCLSHTIMMAGHKAKVRAGVKVKEKVRSRRMADLIVT